MNINDASTERKHKHVVVHACVREIAERIKQRIREVQVLDVWQWQTSEHEHHHQP